jgi:DNA-binding CsgD family transcriptional regulator
VFSTHRPTAAAAPTTAVCDLPWADLDRALTVRADGRSLRAMGHIGTLVNRRDSVRDRATAAIEAISAFAPADGAVLDAWNPTRGRHEPLAALGVPADALTYETSARILQDPGYRYIRARRVAHRRCDVPGAARNSLITEVCDPAGYREGVTACLFNGGRYTGMLNLGFVDDRPLEPWRMALLSVAIESLGRLVDLTESADAAEVALRPSDPAVVVHADGHCEPIPGRPWSHLLEAGSPTLAAARRRAPRGQGARSFVMPDGDGLWSVLVLRLGDAGAAGALLVTVSPASTDLSGRELEVLTLMAEGLANPAIAARLGISPHTVARHVEHVLEKLGVRSRVEAAACAVRDGLVLGCPPGTA